MSVSELENVSRHFNEPPFFKVSALLSKLTPHYLSTSLINVTGEPFHCESVTTLS